MLLAVAAAQVQSIFIATFAASGYFLQGNVSVPLAVVIGVPLLLGVVIGWRVAHIVDPERLKVGLGVVLLGSVPIWPCDRRADHRFRVVVFTDPQ